MSEQTHDDELLRLEELFDTLDEALGIDETQGYLCAALSGPRPIPEAQWLDEVLGASAASEAGREAADLLRRLAARLEAGMARGEAPLLLLYGEEDEAGEENGERDYATWCRAYLSGIDAAEEDWFAFLGAADDKEDSAEVAYLDEQLFPFFMLSGEAELAATEAGEDWPSGGELERLRRQCEASLPQAVAAIYRFWLACRGIGTIRHQAAKVGRNDPCPCGSGRKYKRCCIADA